MTTSPANWGPDPHRLLTLQEAWDCIARNVNPLGTERVSLVESAGRVLAEPIVCKADSPPFDRSMMDGFALRAADCTAIGAKLAVLGLVIAGDSLLPPLGKGIERRQGGASKGVGSAANEGRFETVSKDIGPGQAVRINTGAPLPPGVDAVVRIEDCSISPDGRSIEVRAIAKIDQNIQRRGELRLAGDVVLAPPMRLAAMHLGAAASAGAGDVQVSRVPRAAIVATGDELVPAGGPLGPGQIHESNGLMLSALVREFGAEPVNLGIARDDEGELKRAFTKALDSDVVLVAGGMSMGTHDLVPKVFASLGVKWQFHGVDMRPGKPAAYGRGPRGQHVFGLPGNPVSGFVCAWLFARMAIHGLSGLPVEPPPRAKAKLAKDAPPAKDRRPAFLPARVWEDESGSRLVELVPWSGSADSFGLANANALLVRNDPTAETKAGSQVEVVFFSREE